MTSKVLAYTLRTILILLIGLSVALPLLSPDAAMSLLDKNLPYREAYHPTLLGILYVYALPLAEGFLASIIFWSKKARSNLYFVNISLLLGTIVAIPYILNSPDLSTYWFDVNALGYFLLQNVVLLLLGMLPTISKVHGDEDFAEETEVSSRVASITWKDWGLAIGLGTTFFALNMIPMLSSHYLVGADVYYHASKTLTIVNGESILTNPFFENEKNYYYSVVYYFVAGVHWLTHVPVETLWLLYVPFCALVFVLAFYMFSKVITKSSIAASIATFFAAILNQTLWIDPSVRTLSYASMACFLLFFALFIAKKKWWLLVLAGLFWLLTAGSHPEIAIHIILISIAYAMLSFLSKRKWVTGLIQRLERPYVFEGSYLPQLDQLHTFVALLATFIAVAVFYVSYAISKYSITQIMIFNEVPLSFFQPIGIVSLPIFMLGIVELVRYLKRIDIAHNRFVLSIASLSLTGVFYFTYLWAIYHRYFFETAYYAFAVLAALYIAHLLRTAEKREKVGIIIVVALYLAISLWPRMNFILVYSQGTQKNLASRQMDFDMIKQHTPKDSIILVSPDDIIARYMPFYGERRILAGSSIITKEQQWQVLSFCNGPYSKFCDPRDEITKTFFADPTEENLRKIKARYRADFLLVNKVTPGELDTFQASFIGQQRSVAEDDHYVMYDLRGVK